MILGRFGEGDNFDSVVTSELIFVGRIDRKIEFPLPDMKTKRHIFGILTAKMSLADDVDIEQVLFSLGRFSIGRIWLV